jgi:NTE family protein
MNGPTVFSSKDFLIIIRSNFGIVLRKFQIAFIFTLIYFQGNSQSVALVLSGGGSKGIAHIGVLKYLEEHNIPIDYIAGTSMGAIVGGFYAAGYSPDEIEKIVLSDDFAGWVNGVIGGKNNSYYFSQGPDSRMFSVGLGVDQSRIARLNPGIVSDAALNFILAKYLAKASAKAGNRFDKLFVPFRAMAAEIFTESQVILDSGYLQEAGRASMAVPFLFRPIRLNENQLLFDGGIYNNFPVDVAIETYKPDVVIGSNVGTAVYAEYPYDKDEELVSNNLFLNLINKSDPTKLRKQDIYIKPDLGKLSSTDFTRPGQMIDSGLIAATRKESEIFSKISRRTITQSLNEARENFTNDEKPLQFKSIQFKGFNNNQMSFMKSVFQVHRKSVHSIDDIQESYSRLISIDFFKEIYPRITYYPKDSSYIFELTNKYDKGIKIDLGGFITSRNIGELYLGVRLNTFNRAVTQHELGLYSGRFYQSIRYSSRVNLLGRMFMFFEPEILYNKWDYLEISDLLNVNEPKNKYAEQEDLKAGLNIGWPLGSKYKMVINSFYINNNDRYSNINDINSTDIMDQTLFEGYKSGLSISRNSLNRKQYADQGIRMNLGLYYFNGLEIYTPGTTSVISDKRKTSLHWIKINFGTEHYFKITQNITGGWSINCDISNMPFFSNYSSTILNAPAYYPLNDSHFLILDDFRAMNFAAGGMKAIYKFTDRFDLRAEANIFKAFREIAEDDNQQAYLKDFNLNISKAATLSAVYMSPIGPISLGLNYYSTPNVGLGIFFHMGYLILNERSFE